MRLLSPLFALSTTAAAALPACTGSASTPLDDGRATVTIDTGATPALIALREEGSATWQPLVLTAPGRFHAEVSGPYRLVIACQGTDLLRTIAVTEYARTPEDGPSIQHRCHDQPPYKLQGDLGLLGQSGEISFGRASLYSPPGSWGFALPTDRGSYDLVATTHNLREDMVAIRRDIAIDGDTDLGFIRLIDLNGAPHALLVQQAVETSSLRPSELASSSTLLYTSTTFAMLSERAGWIPKLAPDDVLLPTDRQIVTLYATEDAKDAEDPAAPAAQDHARQACHDVRIDAATPFLLPEPLGPVAFEPPTDRLGATWSELPEHEELWITRSGESEQGTSLLHELALTRGFLEATGATSAAVDFAGVPGFKQEWRIAPTAHQRFGLIASRGTWEAGATSSVWETFPPDPDRNVIAQARHDAAAFDARMRTLRPTLERPSGDADDAVTPSR